MVEDHISLAQLDILAKGDTSFKRNIIQHFLTLVQEVLLELQEGLKKHDVAGIKRTVHKMKPNLLFFGTDSLVAFGWDIQHLCEAPNPNMQRIKPMVDQYSDRLKAVSGDVMNLLVHF